MSESPTSICNMALGRLGANRIDSYDDASNTQVEAIQCRLHYVQARDALIRSHHWRFARGRATLSASATAPGFEYDYAYDLPADFLAMRPPYEGMPGNEDIHYTYAPEGKQILSNETTMKIRYIKRVTDPNEFDPLFIEVLVLALAVKLSMPLSGAGSAGESIRMGLYNELYGTPQQPGLMAQVRQVDKEETESKGRDSVSTWNNVFASGGSDPMYL